MDLSVDRHNFMQGQNFCFRPDLTLKNKINWLLADKAVQQDCWRNFWLLRNYLEILLRHYETDFQGNVENVLQILSELKFSEEFFQFLWNFEDFNKLNNSFINFLKNTIILRLYLRLFALLHGNLLLS